METRDKTAGKRFDGGKWCEKQIRIRTRAALTKRGSAAKPGSPMYQSELARQRASFQAERTAIKAEKARKRADREARRNEIKKQS